MTNLTKDDVKNSLTSILQARNLDQTLINTLLSDNFINGAYELLQNEPENDEFLIFIRNFSEQQNLTTISDAKSKIQEELGKSGYFSNIVQYVIDAWKDINFSNTYSLVKMNNNFSENINTDEIEKAMAIRDAVEGLFRYKVPNPVRTFFGELLSLQVILETVQGHFDKFYKIAENFYDDMMKIARGMHGSFSTAHEQASPLVIDLDGDGIETNEENSTVHFDHDNNGFAESTGWVGKDDGLLVRDLNNNGQIDDGTELFGNNSVLSSGEKAANGFEALKDLDSNNDGVFNSSDTAWNQVKVWKDANSNGVVDEGELLTLEQANVSGINLDYNSSSTIDENGNQHNQTGTFIKTDGTTGSIHDVWFDADYADTVSKTEVLMLVHTHKEHPYCKYA